ncbi:nucleotidyltransferase domain-containing protein [Bacillus lacus]|uniref:Nucleotidyltransferase domain-containing protein n=1 Tax=Metabacillus lacus TaxID=1983721 RepID=A0A7X2IZ25_9BACI|nr:nucleotidyltransferase domain-containing protein [Metabacillus lacus]MRX72420.1 nucleotidyltransferase domain-containing protein [Metabacillus lacus]
MEKRPQPIEAAFLFTQKHFPHCQGAILAGSVVRGQATKTSDLDIVIFDENISSSYRVSLIEFGWNIELFAHNLSSYRFFFESDCEEARPCMPRMVSEGKILKDTGVLSEIRKEAKELLEQGPKEWSKETIDLKRYFITDALDDLIGCQNRGEGIFIANKLGELVSEFILRSNRKWTGSSKWIVRSLAHYDEELANEFVEAFDAYYKTNDIAKIVRLTDKVLKPFDGRYFEGFSLGKK